MNTSKQKDIQEKSSHAPALTELIMILDRSGSMHGLEDDTIGGFNSMLAKQKAVKGDALVTTALFSDDPDDATCRAASVEGGVTP